MRIPSQINESIGICGHLTLRAYYVVKAWPLPERTSAVRVWTAHARGCLPGCGLHWGSFEVSVAGGESPRVSVH